MTDETPRDPLRLISATEPPSGRENLAERIARHFAPLGGADDLDLPPREPCREPPSFADFDKTLAEVRGGFADLTPEALGKLVDEAVAAAREQTLPEDNGHMRHGEAHG